MEALLKQLLQQARDADAEEDARFDESLRGDELPEELRRREDRLAAVRTAKERLVAVDSGNQLIVATELTSNGSDQGARGRRRQAGTRMCARRRAGWSRS